MSASRTNSTNNKNISDKIFLRKEAIKNLQEIKVLDLFAGRNVLWSNIKTDKYYGVDIEKGKGKNLDGDSKIIFDSLDLSDFNVVDVDSFGIDFDLYKKIITSETLMRPAIIIYTLISHQMVGLHCSGIKQFNLQKLYLKCKGLFNEKSVDYFHELLANNGVKEIKSKFYKQYGYFILD